MEDRKTPLEMATELDQMERGVTSREADLLERTLPPLRKGKRPERKDLEALERMYAKYFIEAEDEGDPDEAPEEEEEEEGLGQ